MTIHSLPHLKFGITLLMIALPSFMQAQVFSWAKQFAPGSTNFYNKVAGMDAAGNYYTSGKDFVIKLSPGGTTLWIRQFPGLTADGGQASGIAVDAGGNVLLSGTFKNTFDFDFGPGVFTMTSFGNDDGFVVKLDANGDFVWAGQLGGAGMDRATGVVLDLSGNVYLAGNFGYLGNNPPADADVDPGPLQYMLTSSGSYDMFMVKLDGNGNFIWGRQAGGPSSDYAGFIRVDPLGNVFVSGSFSGTATFDPTATLTAPGTNSDRFIQKLDADGNFIWVKQLLNGGCCLDITDIEFDASGNMLSTGYFSGTVDFDPGAGVYSLTVPNPQDLFVWKLDNNGNFIWAKKVDGGASNASGKTCHGDGIDVDAAGNVYVAGDYTGTGSFDFDPGPATYSLNVNGGAMHVLKLDAAGNFVWVAPITASNGSYAFGYGIQVASDGSVYASCNFSGTVDFDPAKSKYTLNAGNGNFAVVKLAQTAKTLKRVNPEITGTPVIRLFPNPARGNVLVELKEARPSVVLNFYDMTGKLVLSQQRQGSSRQWRVDLSTVMSGMYLVEAVAGNDVHRQLLTVQ